MASLLGRSDLLQSYLDKYWSKYNPLHDAFYAGKSVKTSLHF